MRCQNCGAEQPAGSKFCVACGAPLPEEQNQYGSNQDNNQYSNQNQYGSQSQGQQDNFRHFDTGNSYQSNQNSGDQFRSYDTTGGSSQSGQFNSYDTRLRNTGKNGKSLASLILGIVGIVCCGSYIPSILAIIFGFIGYSEQKRMNQEAGQAIAGIVMGFIGLVASIPASIFFWPVFIIGFMDGWNEAMQLVSSTIFALL